jgi:hypothetical protein
VLQCLKDYIADEMFFVKARNNSNDFHTGYLTVTDLARLRGMSGLCPRLMAML